MSGLLRAVKAASSEMGAALARRAALVLGVAGLLVVAAGFGIAAGWTLLEARFGSALASAIIAGGLSAMAIVISVAAQLKSRKRKKQAARLAAAQQVELGPLLIQTFLAALHMGQTVNSRQR